jgi:hypothetical protein
MKYYVQYKRSADSFYRTHGSLNSAREVMDALRTGRQLDSNVRYIWARYSLPDIKTTPQKDSFQPIAVRSRGPEPSHGCFFDIRSGMLERLGDDRIFRPNSD